MGSQEFVMSYQTKNVEFSLYKDDEFFYLYWYIFGNKKPSLFMKSRDREKIEKQYWDMVVTAQHPNIEFRNPSDKQLKIKNM